MTETEITLRWPFLNDYFEQLESKDDGLNVYFKCILCKPKNKNISTSQTSNSNLRTHIKLVHHNHLNAFNICTKKRSNEDFSVQESKKQLKLCEVGKVRSKNLSQAEFDNANLQLIISTVSPYSLIEHPAFIKYCQITSNKVPVSRRTLMRNVESMYNQMIQQMKDDFVNINYVCITADCWSIFHRSYIGFTVHWIEPNTLERNSKALACRCMIGHHSYDNIAECIDKVLNEFNIQNKTTLVVTDNAANFVKAFRVFSNENETETDDTVNEIDATETVEMNIDPTNIEMIELTDVLESPNIEKSLDFSLPPHQRCAAHTLNLIAVNDIREAEKDVTYRLMSKRVFGKCQKLFNKQNQSTLCADQIKKYLGRYLITPNATRWNSYYDAIKCVVNHIEKIVMICIELQLPIISKPREVAFLNEYCKVMKPIAQALDILQGDKHVSLGYLLPTISVINKSLNEMNNLSFCRPLVNALKKCTDKRFQRYTESQSCQLAACLIPKFKLHWADPDKRNDIKEALYGYVSEQSIENSQESNVTSSTFQNIDTSSGHNAEDDFFSFNETVISNNDNDIKTIINDYFTNNNIKNVKDLPQILKKPYLEFNTAVPSSAHVEHLFSAGGQLFEKRRASIADKNFEMTLLLKFNEVK